MSALVYKPKECSSRSVYNITKTTTKKIASLVSIIQKKKGLTQDQIAEQVGVSRETIRAMFTDNELSNKTLEKIKIWARRFK